MSQDRNDDKSTLAQEHLLTQFHVAILHYHGPFD